MQHACACERDEQHLCAEASAVGLVSAHGHLGAPVKLVGDLGEAESFDLERDLAPGAAQLVDAGRPRGASMLAVIARPTIDCASDLLTSLHGCTGLAAAEPF